MAEARRDMARTARLAEARDRRLSMRVGKVIPCPIDDTNLLVVGTSGAAMEGTVAVGLDDDPDGGTEASVVAWPLAAPISADTHGFAALLPAQAARKRALTTMRVRHGVHGRRYVFAARPADAEAMAVLVAELAGAQTPTAIAALVDVLMKGPIGNRKLAAIIAFLKAGARIGGRIELLGQVGDGEVFLHGWENEPGTETCRVFVYGRRPSIAECSFAALPRQDVPKGASGFAGLLLGNEGLQAGEIEGLLFQRRGAWRHVPVRDGRTVAGPLDTPAHIRALVLDMRGAPETLLRLRSAANRFDGSETVSGLPVPVRMGVDGAFEVEGGVLIAGWLLDPDGHVEAVRLCGAHGGGLRLDTRWTRLDRADVTRSFAGQAPFAAALDERHQAHGFVVFAKKAEATAPTPLHVELTLRDTRRAFMPVVPTRLSARDAALRQLRAIEPSDWALQDVIDRQIVALLSAAERTAPAIAGVADHGRFEDASGPALIVGLRATDEPDIAPLLGLLALNSDTRRAPIVLVVPAARAPRLSALVARLCDFYGLSARLVSADGAADIYDLFEAGAQAVSSEAVILLSASVLPLDDDWHRKLVSAHARNKESIISPTLAYEDHSVRWAGNWAAPAGADRALAGPYAGYPISAVAGLKMTRIAAASLECCIMPREAFFLVGGFSPHYLGSPEKGLDFGLKLSRSGLPSYWLPSVRMLCSDDVSEAADAAAATLLERIDRQIFDARWKPALADRETPSEQVSA